MHPALHAAVAIPFTVLGVTSVHASSEAHVLSSSGCSRPSAPALFIPLCVSFAQIVALLFKACSLSQPIKISLNFTCTHPPRLLFFYKPPFGFRFCSAHAGSPTQRSATIVAHNLATRHQHIKQTNINQDCAQKFLLKKPFVSRARHFLSKFFPLRPRVPGVPECKQRKET